jgi:CDP-glucose 4,6-dehydratase
VSRAFVTGGHGLIGSWLVKGLLERGDAVTVLERGDRPGSALSLEGTGDRVELVRGDVRDAEALGRALGAGGGGRGGAFDAVFHLAGQPILAAARTSPATTFETNVAGTWNLLEACRSAGVGRVIVASSDTVYGPGAPGSCTEELPLRAADPYDASKAAADVIARSYWTSYGLRVAVTRLANVYGGGDMNPSRLVPGSVWAALAGRRAVIRSDGTPERDFLYVEDAVAAYLALDRALADGPGGRGAAGEAFNAGGGETHRVLDIVRAVFDAVGAPFDPDIRGAGVPRGELARQVVDHGKLARLTGWAPGVDLAEGVRRTVAWYRRHAPTPPDAL